MAEDELDVEAYLRDEGEGGSAARKASGSPLAAAGAGLRESDDDDPSSLLDDLEEDDDFEDDGAGAEGDEDEGDAPADGEEADPDAADEDGETPPEGAKPAGAAKPKDDKAGDEPKGHTLTIPYVSAEDRDGSKVELLLEELPQEYYDVLNGHIQRSLRVDSLEAEVAAGRQHRAAADFLNKHPLEAMLLVDQEDQGSEAPLKVGEAFTREWLRANPEAALALIRDLKFDDPGMDAERMKERAETARLRTRGKVEKTLKTFEGESRLTEFVTEAGALIRDLAATMKLDAEAAQDFAAAAAARVKQTVSQRRTEGKNPYLARGALLKVLEPVTRRFGGTAAAPAKGPKGTKPADPAQAAEKMRLKAVRATKHRKVGGGKDPLPVASEAGALGKFKGVAGVRAASKVLRGQ